MTPTARTIGHLRLLGWFAEKVEQRLPIPGQFVTRDYGGFGDVLGAHPHGGILMVQVTVRSAVPVHVSKVTAETMIRKIKGEVVEVPNEIRDSLVIWLSAGGRFEIHGWDKPAATNRWRFRRIVFDYADRLLSWRDSEEGV
jgi:hypothetical protein